MRGWWYLFRAEWRKFTGNPWMAGCFLWLLPGAILSLSLLLSLLVMLDADLRASFAEDPYQWTDASIFFWAIPNSVLGRLLMIGFTAALFAGEYQWGTWKNLIPRQNRVRLIAAKFLALGVFMVLVFGLSSFLWVLGVGVVQIIAGGSYPPTLDNIPSNYWAELAIQASTAFLSTLIIAAIAALIALLTRSILGALMLSLAAVFIDAFIGAALILLYLATGWRFFPSLYRFTVGYNVDNLLNWAAFNGPADVMGNVRLQENPIFGELVLDPPLAGNMWWASYLILGVWAAVLIGLASYSFYRQEVS
jgi:ABC-type transport system involved in multi-copper enzyme maturation permease subunit